ncbi:MAG: 2,3-bisphosphoglycerate-independent phosphoglycerate mutase, partial [Phycisphaerales bacterium]|nr:2,3-bisphosphoglycerate-independent phosphoglycerate mutase [Phycisphaerales bacterium]
MKYAIIIADGAGDLPLPELGGRTPLQAARTPHMDAVARAGRLLTAKTTPPGFGAGSDVCTMDLLGYDPRVYHTGRAPLEAAAVNMAVGDQDWIFRVNLVTVSADKAAGGGGGKMLDHSAGAISDAEAQTLFADLLTHWRTVEPALASKLNLKHGVSYRSSMTDGSGRTYVNVQTTPPHEVPGEEWGVHLPKSKLTGSGAAAASGTAGGATSATADTARAEEAAAALRALIESSASILQSHPINLARVRAGKRPGNLAWIWGQGTKPAMPNFQQRFGVRGGMITAVDLLAGIARLIGWERLDVPGVTSYHDTDYAAQGEHTVRGLDRLDLICCHVESPDESSHQGDWKTKVAAIEAIDEHVVRPVLAKLQQFDRWRVMILPDHYTLVSTRKHDTTPVPVLIAGGST